MVFAPRVRVEVAGRLLPTPTSYRVSIDIGTPSDQADLSWPYTFELEQSLALDSEIVIYLGRTPILTGRIATDKVSNDDTIGVTAYDKVGRLVKESVKRGFPIRNRRISSLATRIIDPWFSSVEFTGASDRTIRRGTARGIAGAAAEPAITSGTLQAIGTRIEPAIKKWEALEQILRPLGLTAWSRADGRALIVARPQYNQDTQYRFTKSDRGGNVTAISYDRSVAGRYASVEVSGTGRPLGSIPPFRPARPPGTPRRKFVNWSSIGRAVDTTGDFRAQKDLFVVDSSVFPADAQRKAEQLLARMNRESFQVSITTPGFGQVGRDGRSSVLYTVDTIANVRIRNRRALGVESEVLALDRDFYITSVVFSESDSEPPQTELTLIPKGTPIT